MKQVTTADPFAPPQDVTLQDVLSTAELASRQIRAPDYQAEAAALASAMQGMGRSPHQIFQQLVDTALQLCGAGSAGISLLERENGELVFRWEATAGAFAPLVGSRLPRHHSPCGAVVDSNAVQLMKYPARYFRYVADLPFVVTEVLLIPFHHENTPVGTLWLAAHAEDKRFDGEDVRLASRLSACVAAAWQALRSRQEIERWQELARTGKAAEALAQAELAVARERVELSTARFEAFFDQVPFYAGIISNDGRVAEVARMALEACGYTREEVIGKPFCETPWWRDSGEIQNRIKGALAASLGGERFEAVLPYLLADGSSRWVDFRLSPVFSPSGSVIFVIAIGIDISDRIRTESELNAVRRRLDSALIAAEIGTYEWDVSANRMYGDDNFHRLFPVETDELGGAPLENFVAVIHPDDRKRAVSAVEASLATGENFEADYRVVVDGAEKWINSRGRMTKNLDGRVVSFFGVIMDITARKRAEEERATISDRYRRLAAIHETVLSATNDFAYVFDLQGRFMYANRQLLMVFAKTLDQVVGRTCYDLGYPTWHADMHMREIAEVIATKRPIRGEVPFTGASGISGIYDYIFSPVFDVNGEVESIAGTTRDVTERKRAENRDRLLVALDDATRTLTDPLAITQASAKLLGEHLNVNRCAYADVEEDQNTFNLTGDYNIGVASIVGRYRFDQFGDECLRLMRVGQPYIVEDSEIDLRTDAVRSSYRATQIRSVICVPLHKGGRFVGAMAVHQTTPRPWKTAEIELVQLVASRCWESIERTRVVRVLASSEQQLRLAVETGRLGVWELDIGSRAMTCSDQCQAIFGQSERNSFSYDAFRAAIHTDDRERVSNAMERAIAEHTDYDLEYRTCWPDGSEHWVLMRGQASYAADGTPHRMIGVCLDITSRKEAEREQVRLREEADRASRAKDDFLATLSHELRTPLNPVLLAASDAARDGSLPEPARALFEMIRKNVELEARLIDDLLDLTTIVRGKLAMKKEAVDLHAVLADAISATRPEFEQKSVKLTTVLGAAQTVVFGDAVRLLQVLLNLLKNAVKFTPQHGSVVVQTAMEEEDSVRIDVRDTGIGMTQEELGRAFGAFEQGEHASSSGSHRFGGLGLGLAISRRLIEMHGGTIEATSSGRDAGTTMSVTLPLESRESREQRLLSTAHATPTQKLERGNGARILLVEDHEPTRNALGQLLRRRNYDVVAAGSVAEARAHAEQQSFDFVISDLGLPDGDGAELMMSLRDGYGLRGVALTGYGMEQDIARCQSAGFMAHLTKPVRVESLEAVLADAALPSVSTERQ